MAKNEAEYAKKQAEQRLRETKSAKTEAGNVRHNFE